MKNFDKALALKIVGWGLSALGTLLVAKSGDLENAKLIEKLFADRFPKK